MIKDSFIIFTHPVFCPPVSVLSSKVGLELQCFDRGGSCAYLRTHKFRGYLSSP